MYKSASNLNDFGAGAPGLALPGGMTAALRAPDPTPGHIPAPALALADRVADWLNGVDWVPDLGRDIGSASWLRGVATLLGLCATALCFAPSVGAIDGYRAEPLSGVQADTARAQGIAPLAFGSDTGTGMAATDAVRALKSSPERPSIEMVATLGRGDSLRRVLQRAGVAGAEADAVERMIAGEVAIDAIAPGTQMDIVLGRRSAPNQPRPLGSLAFRAAFDLNLEVTRANDRLALARKPILVDATPLRIKGVVGSSLYRSARAAGAPSDAVQEYLRVVGKQLSVSRDIRSTDEFDIVIDYRRAETGEVEVGGLLYAGIERDAKPKLQMLKWPSRGRDQWFEASGAGQSTGELVRPANGRVTSGYGMRRHPILRYKRMHGGIDFGGGYGAPIYAVTDGTVSYAGRKGGYGNFVRLRHGGGLESGYAHMSRIAVSSGSHVRRGQIIGYIGSTGLSTGPHLHYELYRNGRNINPHSVKFVERAELEGAEYARFKAELDRLRRVTPGAALGKLRSARGPDAPAREISRIAKARVS